jgi:hypothetical protein
MRSSEFISEDEMAEHILGDLVVYLKDPQLRSARSLYVYLGETKKDKSGKPQASIHAISRRTLWGNPIRTDRPIDVLVCDVIPLADYGMRVARLAAPGEAGLLCWQLWVCPDENLKPEPDRVFGRQMAGTWDWMGWTMIYEDKLGEMIRANIEAKQRAVAA